MTNDDLDQRLAAVEERLGMHEPRPVDPLSSLGFKVDGLRELLSYQGITQGEHGRALAKLQADLAKVSKAVAETQAGVAVILELLRAQDS